MRQTLFPMHCSFFFSFFLAVEINQNNRLHLSLFAGLIIKILNYYLSKLLRRVVLLCQPTDSNCYTSTCSSSGLSYFDSLVYLFDDQAGNTKVIQPDKTKDEIDVKADHDSHPTKIPSQPMFKPYVPFALVHSPQLAYCIKDESIKKNIIPDIRFWCSFRGNSQYLFFFFIYFGGALNHFQ